MTKCEIMGISRHRMGIDGKGIRTLVALYGCPLDCKFCINKHCKQKKTARLKLSTDQLIDMVKIDNIYFKMTGGGITFGGGEPLAASEYIVDFCRKIDYDWSIVIETSLYGDWEKVERLIPYIDTWIVDIKDTNPKIYKTYTGKDNECVLSNLEELSRNIPKSKLIVRIPEIPDYNNTSDVIKSIEALKDYNIYVFDYIRC